MLVPVRCKRLLTRRHRAPPSSLHDLSPFIARHCFRASDRDSRLDALDDFSVAHHGDAVDQDVCDALSELRWILEGRAIIAIRDDGKGFVYRTERDTQRPLVGVTFSKVDTTFYLFNLGGDDQLAVLSFGFSF
jgi:hypothetical protein